jgi:hypothetical protein
VAINRTGLTLCNRPRRCRGGEYTRTTGVEREMMLRVAVKFGEAEEEGVRVGDGVVSCCIVLYRVVSLLIRDEANRTQSEGAGRLRC